MVEQAQEESSGLSPQAGPNEGENHMIYNTDLRRATHLIGRHLAQIGDELDSRWRETLLNQWPRRPYPNMLTWAWELMNERIVGRLWWSKVIPVMQASWMVPRLHAQSCQGAMKWISWVYNTRFPDWSCRTKCFLASAVLLVTVAAFTASHELFVS